MEGKLRASNWGQLCIDISLASDCCRIAEQEDLFEEVLSTEMNHFHWTMNSFMNLIPHGMTPLSEVIRMENPQICWRNIQNCEKAFVFF